MILNVTSDAPYPREMIGAVRAWRAKQTAQERIRWDQIWDYFRADRRLAPGTVLPDGKIVIDAHVVYGPGPRPRNDPERNFLTSRIVKLKNQTELQILAGVRKRSVNATATALRRRSRHEPQPDGVIS
jgi:hypothetical protein